MDTYGEDIAVAYDIACAFQKTVENSSLAEKAKEHRVTFIVPAFHGYAHSRDCQVYWHPTYICGSGKEDFEGCERVFSGSNPLASSTRLSSAFHRYQAIEEHINFWSEEKYFLSGKQGKILNSFCLIRAGNFIYQNYRQALKIIAENQTEFDLLNARLGLTPAEIRRFLEDERTYLRSRQTEPAEVLQVVDYMEKLDDYWSLGYIFLNHLLELANDYH